MAIIAKNSGGNYEPPKAGMQIARAVAMYHIGTVTDVFEGDEKELNKVLISFELPKDMREFEEGEGEKPAFISKEYTLSMNPKANLRKDLDSWRGVPFTDDEAESFDVTKLIGHPCMLNITHKKSAKKKVYATISAITPPVEGLEVPEQITPSFESNFDNLEEVWEDIPEWIQKKIKESKEFKILGFEPKNKKEEKEGEKTEDINTDSAKPIF